MAPAAQPAFKKGPGTGPSIEAAGHLPGKIRAASARRACASRSGRDAYGAAAAAAAAVLGRAAPLAPARRRRRSRAAAGRQGRGIGRPCFARWPGAHARPGQQGHARGRQLRGAGAGPAAAPWLWARGLCPQHDNTTKARPVVARAPNGHGRGIVLGFTCTGQGPEGPPCRWRARCWLRAKGPPPASLAGARGGAAYSPQAP